MPYEPEWALKVRVKSVAIAMLGMPSMTTDDAGGAAVEDGRPVATGETPATTEEPQKKKKKFGLKDALDAVKENVPIP